MTEQKIDLAAEGLIGAALEAAKEEAPSMEEFIGNILAGLQVLETTSEATRDSVSSLHIAIRTLAARVSTTEKFLSYLMTKDPDANEKLKKHLAQIEAAEQAAAAKNQG